MTEDPITSPRQPIRLVSGANTQIQQLKTAGTLAKPSVFQPSGASTISPGSQGLPQVVKLGSIGRKILPNGQIQISVQFTRNPADQNFQSAAIYLKQGTNQPALITSSATSPAVFTVPRSNLAAAVIVQSVGNFGALTLANSPAAAVKL